jgi:phytoene dehydrogenase-like protein
MTTDDSLIIIGAGITGLAAGCYGQMNGYRTQIFELHDKPGGLCTSWHREGYTFDGCIEWLVGSKEGTGFNSLWRELGVVQGRPIVNHDELTRVEIDGKQFILYTNADRLERHMRELAPADGAVIGEFCNEVRRFARASTSTMNPTGPSGVLGKLKMGLAMLPYLGDLNKYSKISVQQFASRFTDPFLRRAFGAAFDLPDFSMIGMLFSLAWMHLEDAGYPLGGSLPFAKAIERRYCDLGGEIHYRSPVEKILVERAEGGAMRAAGVRLRSGAEYRAGTVISAADGHATIFDMLDGRFVDDTIRGYYDTLPIFQPIVQVSLGVARDLSAEPHSVMLALDRPVNVSGKPREILGFRHYSFDPTMAPAGKSVIVIAFESDYGYWRGLRDEDSERYEAEKQRVAEAVIDRLERRFPGLTAQVEAVDVATPLTTERYTGNWQGSIEGWMITPKTAGMLFRGGMRKTLPGLDRFYMAGQWVEPGGGVPTAALSGRTTIQALCKRDGRPFVSSEPGNDAGAEG